VSDLPSNSPYPRGFRARRGLNWGLIGLLYASYYMCRYNFRFATPGLVEEFGFTTFQITGMLSAWSIAYGTGQLVNGLLTDRIGGKVAMLIGAVGTIAINLIFGFASFAGTFTTFAAIWLMNGYVQSFGAPGMIKMNAAWFRRTERGTFAGIFGFMIQMGQFAINNLALLRRHPSRLNPRQSARLQDLLQSQPALRAIYDKMPELWELLRLKHQTARACRGHIRHLIALIDELRLSAFEPLVRLAKTLHSWRDALVTMWRFTKNNGITEGFHRKMKLIQRRAYGFRNFYNYRLRVIAQCG